MFFSRIIGSYGPASSYLARRSVLYNNRIIPYLQFSDAVLEDGNAASEVAGETEFVDFDAVVTMHS